MLWRILYKNLQLSTGTIWSAVDGLIFNCKLLQNKYVNAHYNIKLWRIIHYWFCIQEVIKFSEDIHVNSVLYLRYKSSYKEDHDNM